MKSNWGHHKEKDIYENINRNSSGWVKDIYENIIRNDFRWVMKQTGHLVPIERLPDKHWEAVIRNRGDQNLKRLVIQYRDTLKGLGIKRSRLDSAEELKRYNVLGSEAPRPNHH